MLYNYVKCPHRFTLDLFGDYSKQDPISAFVKLLWEKGTDFEKQVVKSLEIPFLDLSSYSGVEKEKRTRGAMNHGVELIYSGRISAEKLIGEPDLLRRNGDGYIKGFNTNSFLTLFGGMNKGRSNALDLKHAEEFAQNLKQKVHGS